MSSTDQIETLKTDIRRRHLSQLKKMPILSSTPSTSRAWPKASYFAWMAQWSEQAEKQIAAAVKARAHGGPNINWDITLFAFMESAAMYLRDWPSVFKAAELARVGNDSEAMRYLRASDDEIQQIGRLWDPSIHYVTICDLLDENPDSDRTLDGPYCGAFFSSNPETPFIGLVFKGTHPESWSELLVDLHYPPTQAIGHLWNTHVSRGVYLTFFDQFAALDGQVPYVYIMDAICNIGAGLHVEADVDVHVTGHSLGAMYATLCYAEMIRVYKDEPIDAPSTFPTKLVTRDLYTFGCPRLVLEDFTDVFALAMDRHDGSSWRVVSEHDPVPLVPPVMLTDPKFIHLDDAYQVSKSAPPKPIKTERNSHPRPPLPVVLGTMSYHTPWSYYDSLYYAATHS